MYINGMDSNSSPRLNYTLLGIGAALVITGIVLTCLISHPAGGMTAQICLTIGMPLLTLGVIMAIYRKCSGNAQPQTQQQRSEHNQTHNFWGCCRGGGHRLGTN